MRWVVVAIRVLLSLVLMSGPLIAPAVPVWQVIAGVLWPIGLIELFRLLDGGDLDIVDIALFGVVRGSDDGQKPKRVLDRIVALFALWFIVTILGLLFDQVPVMIYAIERSISPLYFLSGTFAGMVLYLATVAWYQKSMRRRYGY